MQKIKVITDSTCDLPKEIIEKFDIEVVPLKVIFGETTYRDGIDLNWKEFYTKLAISEELPTTSQVNPGEFEEVFKKYLDEGYRIMCITISRQLSGTYQSALIAKGMFENNSDIYVLDSTTASFGLGMIVVKACEALERGDSFIDVVGQVQSMSKRVELYGALDTLKYLIMGGRLKGAKAKIAEALNLKPIICLKDGQIEAVGRARSVDKAVKWLFKRMPDVSGDFVALGHAGHLGDMHQLRELIDQNNDNVNFIEVPIGTVIGTHAGPNALGLAYFRPEND